MGGCCTRTTAVDEVRRKRPTYSGHTVNNIHYPAGYPVSYPVYRSTNNNHHTNNNNNKQLHNVDLNLASITELATLPDINLYRAQAIVNYRSSNGPFQNINDILNVPGIDHKIFNTIKKLLYISCNNSNQAINKNNFSKINGYVPITNSNCLRIATWNLKCFGIDRLSKKNVLEVVCLTILNSRFDLIALQELSNPEVLKLICNELNLPKLHSVKNINSRIRWSFTVSEKTGRMYQGFEYNGFIWNDKHSLQFTRSGVLGNTHPAGGSNGFVRRPFIGHYQAGRLRFIVVSVHLKATGLNGKDIGQLKSEISLLPTLMEALKDLGHSNIILLGDFNMDSNDKSFNDLRDHGFQNLIPSLVPTNISARNFKGGHQYDNIWLPRRIMLPKHNGVYGVVREGLIINNNEIISDHCPVWAEIKL